MALPDSLAVTLTNVVHDVRASLAERRRLMVACSVERTERHDRVDNDGRPRQAGAVRRVSRTALAWAIRLSSAAMATAGR